MRLTRPQRRDIPQHADQLDGDRLVGRTQGDALQLACLVREHGPDVLNRLLDMWGPDHVRRVTIALACAINPDAPLRQLWEWLGGPTVITSTTVYEHTLWREVA